jgi:sugar phosphate isomerase/epimerase
MTMKPISVQLYSLRERAAKDFAAVLKDVSDMGYVGVETAGLHGKTAGEVRRILDDLGLKCSSAHVKLPTRETLSEAVDTARALGYRHVISGFGPAEFVSREKIRAAAARFEEAAHLLKPHGLRMGYHNHWWEFDLVEGRYGYEWFLEACPSVFSQLDVYWARNFGKVDTPAIVRKHARNLPLLHIKDGPLVKDQPHVAVGSGKADVASIIQAADESVLEWIVVELDACATDMTEAVRGSYAYLVKNGLAAGRKPVRT